jgi:predicted ATPase/DNA-binding XRE family transcriptional regulator
MNSEVSFGYWLQQRRKTLSLTQQELAQQVGCSTITIRKIEAEERRPSKEVAARLADVLELTVEGRSAFINFARGSESPGEQMLHLRTIDQGPVKHRQSTSSVLPIPATTIIGREREIAAVQELLCSSEVRLITLTGPGGIGKTRLAQQVAASLQDQFVNGVWFVVLAPVQDPALVIATISQTLGIQESREQPLAESFRDYLRTKHLLLVLDNFEQVLEAAPQIAELLATSPYLNVLATSRAPLHLSGEREFPVPPLILPKRQPLELHWIDSLAQCSAITLFVQRAQAVKPDFVLTEHNALAVAEICARLDGLPLAIELAAARIKLLPPQTLLARLHNRLNILTCGPVDMHARHRTLRDTIDWSYYLLEPGEQTLLVRMAIFQGGCSLEAAEMVCNGEGDLPLDVLHGLASLLDKNLLRQAEAADGEPRFTMLETIKEYALERLAQSRESELLWQRHAEHYVKLAEQIELELRGAQQAAWLQRLEQEHDNLRTALQWALDKGASETCTRLGRALWFFWLVRGHFTEGRHWLEAILSCAGSTDSNERAKVLLGAGVLAREQGDCSHAVTLLEESLQLCRKLGDKGGVAETLSHLGRVVQLEGNYVQAATLIEESLALYRELPSKRGIAEALYSLGRTAQRQGNYAQAAARFEECLALYQELGNRWGAAETLCNLGGAAQCQGDYARAVALLEESLALCRELGNPAGAAWALNELGEVARQQGDYEAASAVYAESLRLFRELGEKRGIMYSLHNLGYVALRRGNYRQAVARFAESLRLFKEQGEQVGIASCLAGLAGVAGALGTSQGQDSDSARRAARLFGAAAALLDTTSTNIWPVDRIEYERNMAMVRAQLDETAFAKAWAEGSAMSLEHAIADVFSESMPTYDKLITL